MRSLLLPSLHSLDSLYFQGKDLYIHSGATSATIINSESTMDIKGTTSKIVACSPNNPCTTDYGGTTCASASPAAGVLCTQSQCTTPTSTSAYGSASKKEDDLTPTSSFSVTGWTCASGYEGTASATACSTAGNAYTLSGCTDCVLGQYQDQNDQVTSNCTIWKTCNSGEYISQPGTPRADAACSSCEQGQHQEEDSFSGTSCNVNVCTCGTVGGTPATGFNCTNHNDTICVGCPTGQILTNNTCDTCSAGQAAAGMNAVCSDCDAGKYQTRNPADAYGCTPCGLGEYAEARTTCKQCPAGRYNNAIGGAHEITGCTKCESFTFSTAVGRESSCTDSCPTAVDAGASTVSLLFCILKICLHCFLFNIQMCQQKLKFVDPPFHHNTFLSPHTVLGM